MKFSLRLKETELELETPEGVPEKYKLRELTGAQRDQYLDGMSKRMQYNAEGKPTGLNSIASMQANLVSLSLVDSENKAIPAGIIQKWPATVLKSVFDEAQRLSGLSTTPEQSAEAETVAKND